MKMHARAAWLAAGVMAVCGCTGIALGQEKDAAAKAPASGERVDLTPRYQTGESIRFSQHIVRKDEMSVKSGGPEKMVLSIDQTVEYTLRVEAASESSTSLALEITKIKASAVAPQGKYDWDSSAPADDQDVNNPVAVAFRSLVGSVMQLTLDKDGNITDVKADSKLGPPARGAMQPFVVNLIGTDQVKARWGSILWVKPGREPAAVGSSWTRADSAVAAALGAKFVTETTATLKGVKDGAAEISTSGKYVLEALEKGKEPAATMSDTKAEGSVLWNTKAGRVQDHTWNQWYTMNVNAQGMAVVRTIELKTETKVIADKPAEEKK